MLPNVAQIERLHSFRGYADRESAEFVRSGPWLYPGDQLSDLPERLLAAEITREKLFLNLHQELPYALTVENEDWTDFKDGSARIEQVITSALVPQLNIGRITA